MFCWRNKVLRLLMQLRLLELLELLWLWGFVIAVISLTRLLRWGILSCRCWCWPVVALLVLRCLIGVILVPALLIVRRLWGCGLLVARLLRLSGGRCETWVYRIS